MLTPDTTVAGVTEALRNGPYGRCVYACDNDVVDHQVVNMRFADGSTASFTMTAFTRQRDRETRIFGTRGQLTTDGTTVEVHDFLTGATVVHDVDVAGASAGEGHAGGDAAMVAAFVEALTLGEPQRFLSDGATSLGTHAVVFAAERARRSGSVEHL